MGSETQDRAALAAAILRELDRDYARLGDGQFESVADRKWEERCKTIGKDVVIDLGGRKIQGRAERLDATAPSLLRTEHGHLERIIGGDVRLRNDSFRPVDFGKSV